MPDSLLTIADVGKTFEDSDDITLRGLAARFKAVMHLKALKEVGNLPVEDLIRECHVKTQWSTKANSLGINPARAMLMLDFILAESKRSQKA